MKRLIALVLLLGMLIPMGLVSSVSGAEVDVKPFYFVNKYSDGVTGKYEFQYPYAYARINFSTRKYHGEGELPVYLNDVYGEGVIQGVPDMAQKLKEIFADRPEGTRYIMLYKTIDSNVQPEAMIYMDEGAELYAQWAEEFFKEYKRIGGTLDGVLLDVEYNFTYAHYLKAVYRSGATIIDEDGNKTNVPANPEIYNEIVAHPLYAKEVRPQLEERGFTFTQPSGDKSEIFNINDTTSEDAAIWDAVMHNYQAAYMEKAVAPALKYFPDIMVANYRFASEKAWNSSVDAAGGNTVIVGNAANEEYYVRKPASSYYDTTNGFNKPTTYNAAVYADTVYHAFQYEANVFKNMYASSDTKRISAFIAGFNYMDRNRPTNGTRITPYYSEMLLHIGLLNPEAFFGFIIGPRDTDLDGEPYDYDDTIQVVSELMSELTRMVGAADRKPIFIPAQWNSSFVLSGMYAGGKNVWRLTPDTTVVDLEKFKVEGKDPTFYVDGQTITFPGGKIVEDGKVSHIGTCGYWIETASDVTPIVTSDVDRYRKFPAFGEDFDSYKTGMEYSYYNVEFPTTWKFKTGKGAKAVVEEDKNIAGNKVLALTGDIQMQNIKILENITAGDTYAENQTWEVNVTVPANMGADAKITLLSINDDKGKVVDGGFQIAGGKLSYYNADTYVELADVDVSAGGKFTFIRNMDFNTDGAFTSEYIVCDATGKELAKVKNVPVAEKVKLPLQSIGLDFSKVSGTVYVDDYKLYASGVATDFMLYDEKLGTRVTELDKARSANTAYRLSWLNGSAYEKVYSVVAAYYNGDKLVEEKVIKEVKMAPNTDAVETGIVEVKDGQSVRVYLRNDSEAEDGKDQSVDGNTVMLIAIIAGAVILVSVVAMVVLLIIVKKKNAAPAAEEGEDKTAE